MTSLLHYNIRSSHGMHIHQTHTSNTSHTSHTLHTLHTSHRTQTTHHTHRTHHITHITISHPLSIHINMHIHITPYPSTSHTHHSSAHHAIPPPISSPLYPMHSICHVRYINKNTIPRLFAI